jgi:hypothetical protein
MPVICGARPDVTDGARSPRVLAAYRVTVPYASSS